MYMDAVLPSGTPGKRILELDECNMDYVTKILSKLLSLARFLRYKHFCVLHAKISKIQNGRHFGRENWENCSETKCKQDCCV